MFSAISRDQDVELTSSHSGRIVGSDYDSDHMDELANKLCRNEFDSVSVDDVTVQRCFPKMEVEDAQKHQQAIDSSVARAMNLEEFLASGSESQLDEEEATLELPYADVEESENDASSPYCSAPESTMENDESSMVFCQPVSTNQNSKIQKSVGLIPSQFWGSACCAGGERVVKEEKLIRQSQFSEKTTRDAGDFGLKKYVYDTKLMEMQVMFVTMPNNMSSLSY